MSEYIKRHLEISFPKQSRAVFLWGARKTGKSTYLNKTYPNSPRIDLLSHSSYFKYLKNPSLLFEEFNSKVIKSSEQTPIIIDEVQKVPALLDEVQRLIESEKQYIILCGSSARKLKRNQANLLGGRAWKYKLLPFSSIELGNKFNISKALNKGLIPDHYFEENHIKSIKSYVEDYLKEEIQAEALTRNLSAFSRFLDSTAFSNGELLNYTNIASKVGIDAKTVKQYYEILKDTNLGILLEPYKIHRKRQIIIEMPKFYFFDIGVSNYLSANRDVIKGTSMWGRSFEHFILMELYAFNEYSSRNFPIRFWRTSTGYEIDFIIGDGNVGIEVKSANNISLKDAKGFLNCETEIKLNRKIMVSSNDRKSIVKNGIEIYPWQLFIEELWNGKIF